MRIAQSNQPLLARSREKEVFLQRAECGQSTQIITVAECRSDLFGISLFIMQPATKNGEKEGEIWGEMQQQRHESNRCFPLC